MISVTAQCTAAHMKLAPRPHMDAQGNQSNDGMSMGNYCPSVTSSAFSKDRLVAKGQRSHLRVHTFFLTSIVHYSK